MVFLFDRLRSDSFAAYGFCEVKAFWPGFSEADQRRLYALCGGIPAYAAAVDLAVTAEENFRELAGGNTAHLRTLLEIYLCREFQRVNNVNLILTALAAGPLRFSQILAATGIRSGAALTYTLPRLVMLEFIEKREAKGKKAVYAVADPVLAAVFAEGDLL